MVVQTRESTSAKPYILHDVDKREKIYKRISWQPFTATKVDFITTCMIGDRRWSSFVFEVKKSSVRSAYKQQAVHFIGKLLLDQETFAWQPIARYLETTPLQEVAQVLQKSAITTLRLKVDYENRDLIESLLGNQGKLVMEKVIALVRDSIERDDWPITKVAVRYVKDPEINHWQYALVILFFDSDFDSADRYLHDFYAKLDILGDTLNRQQQDILRRMIFFDVETAVPNG